ncbi:MAG: MarR family transcriptional regulator [Candidatus Dadabacteria bacterium]|nr:MarR family transcriptional regulator [Candidatus Dadabacteria bacterium]
MFDGCIYFNLSALTRKVTRIWEEEFAKLGLSPSHGYLLFALAENPGASQKELGEIMELDPSTVTRFVDALVVKGLAGKPVRGKGASIHLTADGKRLYRKIKKRMDALYERMRDHFGEKEFGSFVDGLYEARQSLSGKRHGTADESR